MTFTAAELTGLIGAYFWPYVRVMAVVMTSPVFGARSVPSRIKVIISLALTMIIVPILPPVPVVEAMSLDSIFITAQQVLIGVALGFTTQLVFSAVITGGQIIAMQMGLGFSLMVDPQNGQQAPVLSQFYVVFVLLVYVSLNGHLLLIHTLTDSFTTLPISLQTLSLNSIWQIVTWGSEIFRGAISIAIPAIASLLVVNLSFGVMTRSAPQLNIFAIGFPLTMMLGFAVIYFSLSSVVPQTTRLFDSVNQLIRGFGLN